MLKRIKEFLFLSEQAKRLKTLERMSTCIQGVTFTMNAVPDVFGYLDTTENDRLVANDMIQNLLREVEKQFKIDYQNYINEQIEYLDNE